MSDELFEPPFNLAGELIDNGVTAEGEARVRALAESEARKAQTFFRWQSSRGGSGVRNYPLHDDTNENAL